MKHHILLSLLIPLLVLTAAGTDARTDKTAASATPPEVQVAILLDTSTSMQGLLEQARTRIWNMVNLFTRAKRDGQRPTLNVGLFEYGSGGFRHLRKVMDLSDDLDALSEALFALDLNYPPSTEKHPFHGGAEFCGEVIHEALNQLKWSDDDRSVRVIIIAGNESFEQGPVKYVDACALAKKKGVVINTIFCGEREAGTELKWQDGAEKGMGHYANINQDQKSVAIVAPQDERLKELNQELNATYIAYTPKAEAMKRRQLAQDALAEKNAGVLASRACAKASSLYCNKNWDLVDATEEKTVDLAKMKKEELPEVLRDLNLKEQKAYIAKLAAKRKAVQEEIKRLAKERQVYVAAERERQIAEAGDQALDDAVMESLQKNAEAKGLAF